MSGKVCLIVGDRGTGKTTLLRSILQKAHPDSVLLHDVGGQYKDIYTKPLLSFEEFTSMSTKVKNAVIAMEEATIFITHHRNEDITNLLVRSRYNNNTIFFIFHSLRTVPRFIYDLSDVIFLLKTKDNETLVKTKFEDDDFLQLFKELKEASWIDGKSKKYSPVKVYRLSE